MILSVSRRTDIPNYYADWFINRIREGFLYVKNPMNDHQVSRIDLSPELVDCIVFWTKNPANLMKYLDELDRYMYYFQFTITPYDKDMERNIPDKEKVIIPCFKELSERLGKERVIWRYDPIVFTDKYTEEFHLDAFGRMAESLSGYTEKCVISFVDLYRKNSAMLNKEEKKKSDEELIQFAGKICKIAGENKMIMASCSEKIDLSGVGIEHNCCIDRGIIEKLIGCRLDVKKDKNQRPECGCVESVEVGKYNTCRNGCTYCYATYDSDSVKKSCAAYDPNSPLLCGTVNEKDKITDRKVKSMKNSQLRLEDWLNP